MAGTPFLVFALALLTLLFILSPSATASPLGSFKGKVVLVTGGSTGIGYATALKFAQNGAKVVLCARNGTQGRISERNITSDKTVAANNGTASYFQADVSNYTQVQQLIAYTTTTYGTLDIAVNNAGISGWKGNITSIPSSVPLGEHDAVLNNFYGVFYCMQEEIRFWQEEGRDEAIIVNTASMAALQPFPRLSMYSASKHAIVGLTKSVAQEFDKPPLRLRINAVAPSYMSTPMVWNGAKYAYYGEQAWEGSQVTQTSALWKKYEEALESSILGQKVGKPHYIADAILYLASDLSYFVSGTVLKVDNGDF